MTRAATVSADTKKRFVTIVVLSVTIIAIGVGAFFVFRAIKAERAANACSVHSCSKTLGQ